MDAGILKYPENSFLGQYRKQNNNDKWAKTEQEDAWTSKTTQQNCLAAEDTCAMTFKN